MPPSPLARLRRLCLALPGAHEVEAWGEPTFRIRNKLFAMYASSGTHHGAGRAAVWCKSDPVNQELMVRSNPARFFVPPYVGPSGWVGVYLDGRVSWAEVAELLKDAYLRTAPPRKSAGSRSDPAEGSGRAKGSGSPAKRSRSKRGGAGG